MTVHALEIYRRETRYALEQELGRKVTNNEQGMLVHKLHMEYQDWVRRLAKEVAEEIAAAKLAASK
jgi:hypothetical protein